MLGVCTPASISGIVVGARTGTLRVIDEVDPDSTHRVPAAAAVFAAVGIVLLFLVVQVAATTALVLVGSEFDLSGELGVVDALRLSLVQVAGIVAAAAMVVGGITTWRRVGVQAPSGAFAAALHALLPVVVVVVGPAAAVALAAGDDIVHPDIGLIEALAYVLLSLLIAVNEELWFRGLLVDVLGGALRPWLVVAMSSVLFGLPHLASGAAAMLNAAAVMFAVGVPFAVVRLRYVALAPLIAWHAVIDTWAFLHTSSVVAEGTPTASEAAVSMILPIGLAIGYVAWYARSTTLPSDDGPPPRTAT